MDIDISNNEPEEVNKPEEIKEQEVLVTANIKLLNQYIQALIINIKPDEIHSSINLIFDSGAVNGILGIGAALYLHNLEKMGYFKVEKVSGCSIGSLIALWYICGCSENMYYYVEALFIYYKKHKNFYIYESIVRNVVYKLIKDDEGDLMKLNERLYINYYDSKKCKNKVISNYKNRDHLITCILRSSHVPFLTSSEHKYKGRYIDGVVPHIFSDKNTNLFIKLISFTNPLNCLNAKTEQNIYSRLLHGIIGVNDFFVNKNSDLCSYIHDTTYLINLHLYIRKKFIFFLLYLIEWSIIIKKHMPECVKETVIYNKIMILSKSYWNSLQNKLV